MDDLAERIEAAGVDEQRAMLEEAFAYIHKMDDGLPNGATPEAPNINAGDLTPQQPSGASHDANPTAARRRVDARA